MSKKGKYCWGWYKQRWREVAPFMLVPDSQFVSLLCLHFQISFFIYRKVCYSPHIASESGGDWFVVEVACDLESYAVVSFHITGTILHGSIQFPVIYISKYKKIWNFPVSHQCCIEYLGGGGRKKKDWECGIIPTVYPGAQRMFPISHAQVWYSCKNYVCCTRIDGFQ